MKSNLLSYTLAAAIAGAVTIAGAAQLTANVLPLVAPILGYLAVVALVAVAAIDYRTGPKSYVGR